MTTEKQPPAARPAGRTAVTAGAATVEAGPYVRHITRLCDACGAPMARQENDCWRCGAACSTSAAPIRPIGKGPASAAALTRIALDRWTNEGGYRPPARGGPRTLVV